MMQQWAGREAGRPVRGIVRCVEVAASSAWLRLGTATSGGVDKGQTKRNGSFGGSGTLASDSDSVTDVSKENRKRAHDRVGTGDSVADGHPQRTNKLEENENGVAVVVARSATWRRQLGHLDEVRPGSSFGSSYFSIALCAMCDISFSLSLWTFGVTCRGAVGAIAGCGTPVYERVERLTRRVVQGALAPGVLRALAESTEARDALLRWSHNGDSRALVHQSESRDGHDGDNPCQPQEAQHHDDCTIAATTVVIVDDHELLADETLGRMMDELEAVGDETATAATGKHVASDTIDFHDEDKESFVIAAPSDQSSVLDDSGCISADMTGAVERDGDPQHAEQQQRQEQERQRASEFESERTREYMHRIAHEHERMRMREWEQQQRLTTDSELEWDWVCSPSRQRQSQKEFHVRSSTRRGAEHDQSSVREQSYGGALPEFDTADGGGSASPDCQRPRSRSRSRSPVKSSCPPSSQRSWSGRRSPYHFGREVRTIAGFLSRRDP